jgi:hypothetical protein
MQRSIDETKNDMKSTVEVLGIQAKVNVIKLEQGLGELKEWAFTCSPELAERIINSIAVKYQIPFERTETGVNLYAE